MRLNAILLAGLLAVACTTGRWEHKDTYTDAFRLADKARPVLSFDGDSTYTISSWYGVPGFDVQFVLDAIDDSTTIDIKGDYEYRNGFYFVPTGLEETPTAGISPGLFEPNHTILSGFYGDADAGRLWSYVYLYDKDMTWVGGHYYFLHWGKAPEQPVWTVEGKCTLPGDPAGRNGRLEAYADGHYTIRDWYGVEKYDLDFAVNPDGGIKMLDWYAAEEDGSVWVQARRSDLGDPLVPQAEPNGALEMAEAEQGAGPAHGRLHFAMTIHDLEDNPIEDAMRPEFVFEW